MSAVRVSDVTSDSISTALERSGCGTNWHDACHVTPAGRLALEVGRRKGAAIPLGTLLDIIVSQGLPEEFRTVAPSERVRPAAGASEGEFVQEWARYKDVIRDWRGKASAAKVRLHLHELQSITKAIRKSPQGVREALWHGRHDLLGSFRALASSGIRPEDVVAGKDAVVEAARQVWASLENEVPAFTRVRSDIWHDRLAMQQQETDDANELKRRIEASFSAAFGSRPGPITLVYHGFYFYTPLQWGLFQLLGAVPGVRQVFIVHDDGRSPVFESWRHYFAKSVGMPEPQPVSNEPANQSAAARVLDLAIRGERVEDPGTASLKVRVFEDVAGFVSALNCSQQQFAAEHEDLIRKVARLASNVRRENAPLGALPVGQYLVRLHQCVQTSAEQSGPPRIVLTPNLLIDLCASGFIHFGFPASEVLPALERSLPFFAGCEAAREWVLRADHLRKLVQIEVHPLGARPDDPPTDALSDISTRIGNELRLAPWCDLSASEANRIFLVIQGLVELLEQLFHKEQIALKEHFNFIGKEVKEGLDVIHPSDRAAIEAKLKGMGSGLDGKMSVDAIIDVIQIVVGRETEFDEDASGFSGSGGDEGADGISLPRPLRDLDALSLRRPEGEVVISNLHDAAFPTHAPAVPWPFNIGALPNLPTSIKRLFLLREQIAPLGDLYLLWLGLCNCEKGATINWIRRLDGEVRNPSTAISLLLANDRHRDGDANDVLNIATGGVPLVRMYDSTPIVPKPSSIKIANDSKLDKLAAALASVGPGALDVKAAAHAVACPRRLALQWVLADSAAFIENWHHARLYGTLRNRLIARHKRSGIDQSEAERLATATCNDLFRFLTPGERVSSARLATAPNHAWALFLSGSEQQRDDEVSLAYLRAKRGTPTPIDEIAPQANGVSPRALPTGKRTEQPPDDEFKDTRHEACKWCPMANRCLDRVRKEW